MIRILSQYVNYRARFAAANKNLKQERIDNILRDIWFQLQVMLFGNLTYVTLVLLRTDVKNYSLDIILYPLFAKAHELMVDGCHIDTCFPPIMSFIATVLFYKQWQQMFTEKDDKRKHIGYARKSMCNHFQQMPEHTEKMYDGFIRRVDDRIYHSALNKTTAL